MIGLREKRRIRSIVSALLVAMGMAGPAWAAALGTAFTFQGQLKQSGAPAPTGTYQMIFELYADPQAATLLGTVGPQAVQVTDGLFSEPLDFGAGVFDGNARWIRITVEGTPLSPLQEITPGPYALFAADGAGAGATPWQTSGSDIFYDAGNVGIGPFGATTPTSKLHLSSLGGVRVHLEADTNNVGEDQQPALLMTQDGGLIRGEVGYFGSTNHMQIRTEDTGGGTSHLSLMPEGNVGIGTANPSGSRKLTIQGYDTGTASQWLQLRNAAGTDEWHLNNLSGGLNFVESGVADYRLFLQQGGNVGIGTSTPQAKLDVAGTIRGQVVQITGADVAERFPVSEKIEPGMVVEIDPERPGQLRLSCEPYSRRVAGVVSGANGLPAGAVLGNLPGSEDHAAIALTGRVWCWAEASYGAIEPGDRLTTSATSGHAMKVTEEAKAAGAVIGKAMTPLEGGRGMVLVLIQPH